MESLYLLIPLSIILAFIMGYFFWWSTKNGQFDDLKGPAHRILMDNDDIVNEPETETAPIENKTETLAEQQEAYTESKPEPSTTQDTEEQKNNE